jgi:hypothetical protein
MFKNICKAAAIASVSAGGISINKYDADKQREYYSHGEVPPAKYIPMCGMFTPHRQNQEAVADEVTVNTVPK